MPELVIVTILTTLSAIVCAYFVYRSKSREIAFATLAADSANKVTENTTMVTGFSVLFETMRKNIESAQTQIDKLRAYVLQMQDDYAIERKGWATDKHILEQRIMQLEMENEKLAAALKTLQGENIALKVTLEEIRRSTHPSAAGE